MCEMSVFRIVPVMCSCSGGDLFMDNHVCLCGSIVITSWHIEQLFDSYT